MLAKFSAPQANFFEKTVKKAVFGHLRFFGACSPSKIAYIGAKGAFRKILGSVGQKWISEKVSKGGPFGSAGGQIPERGEGVVEHLRAAWFFYSVNFRRSK